MVLKNIFIFLFSFFQRFYLFIHERYREREAETQAEGEAGSMQGARCGTPSWVSRITPWAEGSAKPLSHLGCPRTQFKGGSWVTACPHRDTPTTQPGCESRGYHRRHSSQGPASPNRHHDGQTRRWPSSQKTPREVLLPACITVQCEPGCQV